MHARIVQPRYENESNEGSNEDLLSGLLSHARIVQPRYENEANEGSNEDLMSCLLSHARMERSSQEDQGNEDSNEDFIAGFLLLLSHARIVKPRYENEAVLKIDDRSLHVADKKGLVVKHEGSYKRAKMLTVVGEKVIVFLLDEGATEVNFKKHCFMPIPKVCANDHCYDLADKLVNTLKQARWVPHGTCFNLDDVRDLEEANGIEAKASGNNVNGSRSSKGRGVSPGGIF